MKKNFLSKTSKGLFLLIIPALLFVCAIILKNVQGPYYLNFYDPSYVYLISSLNLAQGFGVGHFDHPGTTVQVIGAVIIKLNHLISNPENDIAVDVLARPEAYLRIMNTIFILINCAGLFLLGSFTYKVSGNFVLSLLIQMTPFVSMEIFYGLIIVTPENFIIFVTLCFVMLMMFYIYKVHIAYTPLYVILSFGIVCGLGLATKLNFLPLLIIPLILIKGTKKKIFFCLFTLLSFLVFVFPALSNYDRFFEWVERLFLFSGHYGTGSENVIDSNSFAVNLKSIFTKDIIFTSTYIIVAATVGLNLFKKTKEQIFGKIQKEIKISYTIFIAMTLQIIMVAKHYAQYYMLPSFLLCIFALIVCSDILISHFKLFKPEFNINKCFISIFAVIFIWSMTWIVISYNEGNHQRSEAMKIEKFINDNYSNEIVISSFGSASQECALAFSTSYGASQTERYNELLTHLQSHHIFYNPWIDSFHSIERNEDLKTSLLKNKKIILQINSYGSVDNFIKNLNKVCGISGSSFKKVFTNGNNESVYEIYLEK